MSQKDIGYEVGFCKPPKSGQFKKGESGNPKGRRRGERGLKTDLRAELNEKLTISENGKSRKFRKQQLVVKQLINKALRGDIRAVSKLLDLNISVLGVEDEAIKGPASLSINDQVIMDDLRRRMKRDGAASDG